MPSRLGPIPFPDREPQDDPGPLADLIARLSDPGPGPHADNFVSNEDSYPRICGLLRERAPRNSVYLGVGPDQNFTFLAHARPSRAFILDYRRRNLRLHLLHRALFELAPNRVSYLRLLTAREPGPLDPDPTADALASAFEHAPFSRDLLEQTQNRVEAFLRPLGILSDDEWTDLRTIHARMAGPGLSARFLALPIYPTLGQMIRTPDRSGAPAHFLSLETLYSSVRSLQVSSRVVPVVADLAGDGALPRLASWLSEWVARVGVVYVSDVEFFLLRSGRFPLYLRNLERLPLAPGALLIRSTTQKLDHPGHVPGDTGTTVTEDLSGFLRVASSGAIRSLNHLFNPNRFLGP